MHQNDNLAKDGALKCTLLPSRMRNGIRLSVELAPDILVATNDLRDRLICWKPGQPAHPIATIGVSRLTGRSVQDICLVAET